MKIQLFFKVFSLSIKYNKFYLYKIESVIQLYEEKTNVKQLLSKKKKYAMPHTSFVQLPRLVLGYKGKFRIYEDFSQFFYVFI